jgi:hypothetical protein
MNKRMTKIAIEMTTAHARRAALEEAANVADHNQQDGCSCQACGVARNIARRIRALPARAEPEQKATDAAAGER